MLRAPRDRGHREKPPLCARKLGAWGPSVLVHPSLSPPRGGGFEPAWLSLQPWSQAREAPAKVAFPRPPQGNYLQAGFPPHNIKGNAWKEVGGRLGVRDEADEPFSY